MFFLKTTFNPGFKICESEIGFFALHSLVCNTFSLNISTSWYSKAYNYVGEKKQLLRWLILSTWIHLPRCRLPGQHNTLVTKDLHSHVLEINIASQWLRSWWEVTMTKSFHSMIHFPQYLTPFLFHDSFSLCDTDISDVSHFSQRLVQMESKDLQVLGVHWEPKVQILQNWLMELRTLLLAAGI